MFDNVSDNRYNKDSKKSKEILKMEMRIKKAKERVEMMGNERKRLEEKYMETKDELYREMADSTSRQINETMIAIVDAERNL